MSSRPPPRRLGRRVSCVGSELELDADLRVGVEWELVGLGARVEDVDGTADGVGVE